MADSVDSIVNSLGLTPKPTAAPDSGNKWAQFKAKDQTAPQPKDPHTITATKKPWYSRVTEPFVGEGSAAGTALAKSRGEKWAAKEDTFSKPLVDVNAAHLEDVSDNPVVRGAIKGTSETAGAFTTPRSVELLAATGGLWKTPVIGKLVSAGFGLDQIKEAFKKSPELKKQIGAGDTEAATKTLTQMVEEGAMGALALKRAGKSSETAPEAKAASKEPPPDKPTVKDSLTVAAPEPTPLQAGEATKPVWDKAKTAPKPEAQVSIDTQPAPETPVTPKESKESTTLPAAFASGGFAEGKTGKAKVARGYKVPFKYAVVDADNLITSNHPDTLEPNPNFDQSIQPRDRTRAGYEEQINTMTVLLDPEELGASYKASDGAPIVGEDGMVESGNGRSISLKLVYASKPEKATEYQSWLSDNAKEFGIDPDHISAIKKPVLVRLRTELPEGVTRPDFALHANEDSKATMGAVETATQDSQALTPEVMRLFEPSESGDINTAANRAFVQKFAGSIVGPGQKNPFQLADGSISSEGVRRIKNAIFSKAYGGSTALDKLAEDPSDNTRAITNGLVIAAPKFADIQSAIEQGEMYDLNPSKAISKAVSVLTHLRDQKLSIQDYLNQEDLYGKEPIEGI